MINKRKNNSIEREVFETLKKCKKETKYLVISMEKILSKQFDVNFQDDKTGITFLMLTIENDLPTLFDVFLSYHPLIDVKNEVGETAVHVAARSKNPEYLDTLINIKANLNAIDYNGNAPIYGAIKSCIIPNIKKLIDNDVVLNYLNGCGLSIYDVAFMTGDLEVINFVLNYEKKVVEKKKKNIIKRILKK